MTGTTTLNGTADVTSVSLNAGTLALGSTGRFTNNQVALTGSSGGSISLGGDESVGSLAGGFNVALGSATLTAGTDDTSTTYSGVVSGSGGLTKTGSGRLTLAGPNTYSGLTTIAGGTLALSGSGSIGTGGLNLGTTASPGVFDLSALMSGTYWLPATGDLSGAGTLEGDGKTLAVLGSFLPGNSPGTVTLGPGLTLDLSSSGTSVFQITSPLYLVDGTGSVIFGGILRLDFSGGAYAAGANVLQLFTNAGGFYGNFSSVVWAGLGVGQTATFDASTGYVSITAVPEPSACAMALAGLAFGGYSLFRRRKRD
ncbi:MAG: PEP-CTERM sorting domain-containing protein [Planctomycetia bacterium]|nr:PEP-CTERM sorting domain-containing protein [Planctomycetia bacterium]